MTGSNASNFTPLSVGISDSGDFSSYLGRPVQVGDETYVVMQCGVAIASGSQGKQLVTAVTSGLPTWVATICTGQVYNVAGAIPSTLTVAIVSGAYFLALRDSPAHVLATIGALTGAVVAGEPMTPSTGGGLINLFTGSMGTIATGASTLTGLMTSMYALANSPGISLEAGTGIALITGMVKYHAPFRGAN